MWFLSKNAALFSCLIKQMHLLDGGITRRKREINGHDDVASNAFLHLFKIVIFCSEFRGVGIRLFKVMHWHTCSLHWICCYLRRNPYDSCLVQRCFSRSYCQRRLLFCQIYINFKPEKPTINTYQMAKGSSVFSLSLSLRIHTHRFGAYYYGFHFNFTALYYIKFETKHRANKMIGSSKQIKTPCEIENTIASIHSHSSYSCYYSQGFV